MAPQDEIVSVVVIFLDEERFLAQAVDSVFAQTRPHWELLLIDAGSSDSSTEAARTYAATHPEQAGHVVDPPNLLLETIPLGRRPSAATCTFLIRREVAQSLGGFEAAFTGWAEDLVFLTKVFLNCRVVVMDEVLAKYRMHEQSHTA